MSQETHVPDWILERYLLDELPRKERRQMEREMERDPALRAELEKLRQSDRQVLASYPPDQVIPQILSRARLARNGPAPARRRSLAWVAVPALATAVLLLVILPPLLQRRLGVTKDPGEYTGIKGGALPVGPALQVFRQRGDAEELLRDGAATKAGDLLQLAYSSGGSAHGVILSIDGDGAVTRHFPEQENGSTTLRKGRRVFLSGAYELDQAPGFERFIFVTAAAPLSTTAIMEKARDLAAGGQAMSGSLDLPAGCAQFSLLLRK